MRGSRNSQTGGLKYISFLSGKFVERVEAKTPGSVERVLEMGVNAGKVVHELIFDTYEGQITNITVSESSFGKRLNIFLDISTPEEPNTVCKIDLSISSSAAKGFLKRTPNIDFSQDVVLKGYSIEDKEKGRTNFYLIPYQGGKVEYAFTKENPNGFPEMKKIKVKGKETWDDTEQIEFLENLIGQLNFAENNALEVEPEPEIEGDETALAF